MTSDDPNNGCEGDYIRQCLTLIHNELRCVNSIRCPKGLRSMGSNDTLRQKGS